MKPSVKKLLLFGSVAPYSGALLALDFVGSRTSGQPYYMLNGVNYPSVSGVPGWTYTGGTAAGVGSYAARQDGSLQFFPSYTNLLLQSQTFGTTWTTVGAPTISSDAVVAPDGTTTADRITSGASGNSGVYQTPSASPNGVTLTQSIYVSTASTATTVRLGADYGPTTGYIDFNPSTGLITQTGAGITSSSVLNVGGGWYRVQWSFVSTATGSSFTVYSKSGVGSTAVVWGAQLELGSTASTYIPTTTAAVTVGTPRITDAGYWAEEARTNLHKSSGAFTNTSDWTAINGTVATNAQIAPDGVSTSFLITSSNTNGNRIEANGTGPAVSASTTYTGSFWLAQSTGRYGGIMADNGASAGAIYDLQNGSVVSTAGVDVLSAAIVAGPTISGVKWWRCTLTFSTKAAGAFVRIGAGVSNGSTYAFTIFPSAGSGAIYAWGAQMELGSFATSPIPTTSVAVTRAADVGYVSGLVVPMSAVTMLTNSLIGPAMSNAGRIGNLSDGTNNMMASAFGGTNQGSAVAQGISLAAISSAQTAGQIGRVAVKLEGTALTASGIGEAATSVAGTYSGAATATRLYVGNTTASDRPSNTAIRRIVIYPRAFGNAELQAITTAGAY